MSKPTITRPSLHVNKAHFRRFNPDKQPPPGTFYRDELGELRRANSRGWAQSKAGCPFHDSNKKTSFAINVNHGGFRCLAPQCGQHGSMIDFVMRRHGFTFLEAGEYLGAVEDADPAQRLKLDAEAAKRSQEREAAARAKEAERARRLGLRNEIHAAVAIQAETSARLDELLQGALTAYENEAEDCWNVLALAFDDMRQTEAEYMQACGFEAEA